MNYEQQLQALNHIIQQLENGELSLEQSLAAYEQGVALVRSCQAQLKQAEQRIMVLQQNADGETLTPLSSERPPTSAKSLSTTNLSEDTSTPPPAKRSRKSALPPATSTVNRGFDVDEDELPF